MSKNSCPWTILFQINILGSTTANVMSTGHSQPASTSPSHVTQPSTMSTVYIETTSSGKHYVIY